MNSQTAQRNIQIQTRINFIAGFVFLVPVVTLLYQHVGLSLAHIVLISNISTMVIRIFELPTSVFADTIGRKKSLVISVVCNFVSAFTIALFPSLVGFVIAAFFAALYRSFWSGTGQAFLEENLRVLGREKEFGKKIGHFMALENLAGIVTPLFAARLLKSYADDAYTILAIGDVFFAFILIVLTLYLKEDFITVKFQSFKQMLNANIDVAKKAFDNVVHNSDLRLLLVYRSLSNHVSFFFIVSLPLFVQNGMQPWIGGVITAVAGIAMMITNKYAYLVGEKRGYHLARVLATVMQAALLIIAGLVLQSWILSAIIFVMFNFFEGLWMPAWNHVLVEQTQGIAIATTRSIVFSIFALYTTLGKQLLSWISVEHALVGSGIFIILINLIFAKKILALKKR